MKKRDKKRAIAFLVAATLALIVLTVSLPDLQFYSGQSFSIEGAPLAGAGDTGWSSSSIGEMIFLAVRGILALVIIAMPIYIVVNLMSGRGRQRLLGDIIALGLIVLLLTFLSGRERPPQDQEAPPLTFGEQAILTPAGPVAEFTADAPPWADVIALPAVAIFISGVTAVVLWGVLRRFRPAERKAMEVVKKRMAEQAQEAIDALQAGDHIEDTIIRSYARFIQVVQDERGIHREKTMTPHEFEQTLTMQHLPAEPVHELTRLFELVRYGNQIAGDLEKQRAIASLQEIAAFCKGSGGSHA